jgi:CheY-like chemotaxis protein
MNLVVNARDAMPRAGNLMVETYHTEITEEDRAHYPQATLGPNVVLAVSDSGVGIDPEILPSIFEPFFTTKAEAEGTGLGLATVYGIVTDSGGHLRVESALGQGTTFRVFFPAEAQAETALEPTRSESLPTSGSGVILLAEDEEAVAKLTRQILERAGYEVLPASDGQVALDMARNREGPIHLLLSDVVMPELRGPELAQILAREGRVDRAVLISGYAEGMRETSLGELAAWELIPKPFKAAQLLEAIERVLEG